ncbi:DUF4296 domain-containing protein [Tenacibaculum haliotis]|uniref:DUF4296 domain-containing protein n=1 Tax=Tenacibaculum haliotis TaxID=1888914 RepID=UPI0021B089C7|nr:DUF4296 domain-containing protein [Tenacibaculum haliotis]MCT4700015.1 DUF4296 domain-containing protein [Tenacibaculum haliotis]
MKKLIYILIASISISCTSSNTIYKEPKTLIPKDSMVALLTDMFIASSANNVKNKFLKKEKNYMILVYEKYKIDSTRFDISNKYYVSKTEEYTDLIKKVKSNIDSIELFYIGKDSLNKKRSIKPEKVELLEEIKESKIVFKDKLIELKKRK